MKRTLLMSLLLSVAIAPVVAMATETTNTQPRQPPGRAEAAPPPVDRDQKTDKKQILPSLMVMSAKEFTYKDGKLTLEGVSPTTVIFTDRPKRMAGSVPTESFVADWAKGRDSFEKVPPNADFSTFDTSGAKNAVIELKNPVMNGSALTYDVKVLRGSLAAKGGESSMFIDIIGMPWTPMSFAGVARRSAARAAYWSMPHPYVAPAVVGAPPVVVAPEVVY